MMRWRWERCLLGVLLISVAHAAPPQAPAALSFVTWKEPNEGAYTINVPQGWKISGGIRRRTPVDVRSAVNVVSPDGTIHIFIGDYDVPPAREPDQLTQMAGMREGQIYDWVLLARYQTGGVPKITRDPGVEQRRDDANRGTRRVCDDLGTCKTVDNTWTHVWRDHNGNTVPGPASGYPPDYSGQWTLMK